MDCCNYWRIFRVAFSLRYTLTHLNPFFLFTFFGFSFLFIIIFSQIWTNFFDDCCGCIITLIQPQSSSSSLHTHIHFLISQKHFSIHQYYLWFTHSFLEIIVFEILEVFHGNGWRKGSSSHGLVVLDLFQTIIVSTTKQCTSIAVINWSRWCVIIFTNFRD